MSKEKFIKLISSKEVAKQFLGTLGAMCAYCGYGQSNKKYFLSLEEEKLVERNWFRKYDLLTEKVMACFPEVEKEVLLELGEMRYVYNFGKEKKEEIMGKIRAITKLIKPRFIESEKFDEDLIENMVPIPGFSSLIGILWKGNNMFNQSTERKLG